ncbi:MAG TPA: 4'-phosphopantetheinyl transferase superfamily protein [Chitinophagaceae bacterium]
MNADVTVWKTGPAEYVLDDKEVHIWRFQLDDPLIETEPLFDFLSNDEKQRAEKFYFEKDRRHYIIARYQLRRLLGEYLNIQPDEIEFTYNSYGKPLFHKSDILFNVSHSRDKAVYAFGRVKEIGIDIELINDGIDVLPLAERFFAEAEVQKIKNLKPEASVAAFFNCWTRKEAYIKAKGMGITLPLNSFIVDVSSDPVSHLQVSSLFESDLKDYEFLSFSPYSNCIASVCVSARNTLPAFFEGNS